MKTLERKLNQLLANHVTMMHKVQAYHWLVEGPEFFATHNMMEGYYDALSARVDEIAEKILMIGGTPLVSMGDFLANAGISEATARGIDTEAALKETLAGFEMLRGGAVDLRKAADETGGTNGILVGAFADDIVSGLSKDIWMLRQATGG